MRVYISRAELKKQIAVTINVMENLINSLTIVRNNIPENGKRFDARNFNNFNELLPNRLNYRISKYDDDGIKVQYFGDGTPMYSQISLFPYAQFGGKRKWYASNKIVDREAFMHDIDACMKSYSKYVETLKSIDDNAIDDYIAKWNKVEGMVKELRSSALGRFSLVSPSIWSSCPIHD